MHDKARWLPLKVSLAYAILSGLWIVFSDQVLSRTIRDPEQLTLVQTYKGWAFILVTAALLYAVLKQHLRYLKKADAKRQLAEQRWRVSDALYHQLLEHSPALIYKLQFNGDQITPVVVSDNMQWLLGTPATEATYQWWIDHLHPDDRERALATMARTRENGGHSIEYRVRHADGSYLWIEDNNRVVHNAAGGPVESIGVWTDITARKELERVAALREQQLNSFFCGATAGLAIFDRDLRFVQINETLAAMNGLEVEDHLGRTLPEIVPALGSVVQPLLEKVRETKQAILNVEVKGQTRIPDRGTQYWTASYFPIFGNNDQVEGVGAIVVEITQQKQTEARLMASEERFRQLAENIQEVLWITDARLEQVLYISPAFERIWGRTCASRYESPQSWINTVHAEDRQRVWNSAITKSATGEYDETFRIVRPDGTIRWIHDRAFPIRNEAGEVYRIVGTSEDITTHVNLEQEFRHAQKMESLGQLAGGVAHDFNNLLGAIMGYTELAQAAASNNPAAAEYMENVLKASERAADVVRQVLTFSRRNEFVRRPTQLKPVVEEGLKLLRASVPATVEFETRIAATPPVLADASAIHQIVMNLGTNAWHAMREKAGTLTVELGTVEVDETFARRNSDLRPGTYVQLLVADNGCGMDPSILERIFDPFFTTKPPGEGTGLGLAVVHGIMKSHEGCIFVESRPGKGTRFQLFFPVHRESAAAAAATNKPVPSGRGQRILFVDDEEALAVLGKNLLERLGYSVTTLTSPAEALATFRADPSRYDLVITDFIMPGTDGTTVARQMLEVRPDVPILLSTGYRGTMTSETVRQLGFRGLLVKPNTMQTLGEAVHRALNADNTLPFYV